MNYKNIVFLLLFSIASLTADAASSDPYQIPLMIIDAAGTTYAGNNHKLLDVFGEPVIGQVSGPSYSVQSGFFNTYFILPSTPTVTPTITVTCTPIRTFDGELLNKSWVFAAPNPIRGHRANIVYHLAEAAEVEIKIYSTSNKLVISKHWSMIQAGENHWSWNTSNIANGVYIMRIKATNYNRTTVIKKKIALIK